MTRLRAICTAVALVCASGPVLADTASHNASAEAFLTLAHADKLGTPVYMQVQQMFAQRFEQTKAPESKKATLETYQAKANAALEEARPPAGGFPGQDERYAAVAEAYAHVTAPLRRLVDRFDGQPVLGLQTLLQHVELQAFLFVDVGIVGPG